MVWDTTMDGWTLLIGSLVSLGLAVGPWMFKVHAKLAVIASKIVDLCDKMDRASEEHRRLVAVCAARVATGYARSQAVAHRRAMARRMTQGSAAAARDREIVRRTFFEIT